MRIHFNTSIIKFLFTYLVRYILLRSGRPI